MRRSSARAATVAALVLATAAGAAAHRLDGYLQASRIDVASDRVEIAVEVRPGRDTLGDLRAAVDADRDGSLSAAERAAFGDRIRGGLSVLLDGRPLALTLKGVSGDVASIDRGDGLRVTVFAPLAMVAAGKHRLEFRNANLPEHCAYLANALVPADARVSIAAQRRTPDQSGIAIDYQLAARGSTGSTTAAVGVAVAAMVLLPAGWRCRRTRKP
jgi:hypothetical protein